MELNKKSDEDNNLDYSLDYLLERGYNSFKLDKAKVILVTPKVEYLNKKTYILNFTEMCTLINRSVEELDKHFKDELRMDTSIKSNSSLFIDKIVQKDRIENIYKGYITDYVMCTLCYSIKTDVIKKDRIRYLLCNSCKCEKAIK